MKKVLPVFFIVLVGLLVIGGIFWLLRKPSSETSEKGEFSKNKEEKTVKELSLQEKPFVNLVPGPSCEYTLSISGVKGDVAQLEYEVVYKVDSGITQGVPGTIKLNSKTSVTRDLLFGTESSGHRKCDKGVEQGAITLKYRDEDGKLLAKLESDFRVYEGAQKLSLSGFIFDFGKTDKGKYVVMGTMGLPPDIPGKAVTSPYGVFGSPKGKVGGTVVLSGEGTLYAWDGSGWKVLKDGKVSFLGTFVKIASD